MPRRKTIEQVRQVFNERGYALLSDEYKNAHVKLLYICPKGHRGFMTWNKFKSGHGCGQCAGVIDPVIRIEMIRKCFDKEGYKLLSTKYKNPSTKLDFICPQGHRGGIRWVGFSRGHRCAECAGFINPIVKVEQVRQSFAQCGYALLSDQYLNAHANLKFICDKGHENHISWTNFYNLGHRCSKCWEPKSEKKLGKFLGLIFPGKVKHNDNLDFLGLLRVDYSIRELKIAFEYDGQHHFMPTQYGNMSLRLAQERLPLQQERDRRKERLCKENGYTLIRIAYYEELTLENVQKKINEVMMCVSL